MSDPVARPVFFEGQILGALDLQDTVEYSRGRDARHSRYLHTWGIATGLELSKKEKEIDVNGTPVKYQEIWLSPGMAIDGRGREIVVSEAQRLSEVLFGELNVAVQEKQGEEHLYPVLLIGRDRSAPPSTFTMGDCASPEPTRQLEDYEITFRGPGEDLALENQTAPDISSGPSSGNDEPWLILLGYVKWDNQITKFKGFEKKSGTAGRRYAGVLADEVAARGGRLLLRTQGKNQSDKPALIIDETDEGSELKFGNFNSEGTLVPVLTVKENGDIVTPGMIKSKVSSGTVYVQSGLATDGVVLPLPTGVKAEDVAPDKGTLHVQVSMSLEGLVPPANPVGANWAPVPIECSVDADRRVRCQVRWLQVPAAAPNFVDLPGVCNYVLMVGIPATGG
jgi:hypothetical protein